MAAANGFLARSGLVNGVQRQGDFDEFLRDFAGVIGVVLDVLAMCALAASVGVRAQRK